MIKHFKIFLSFLKSIRISIITVIVSFGIFLSIYKLYSLPSEPFIYAAFLCSTFFLILGIVSFLNFYRKHRLLNKLKNTLIFSDTDFPESNDLLELDYQELIKALDKTRSNIINEKDLAYNNMLEYYTVWVHQIKTPIAAMRLLLQYKKSEMNSELLDQLFKIEQYVEMVLQYLRLEDMNSDLVIKKVSLDDLVKQAVRKYSKSFIRKKIKLNYNSLNRCVLTDEKWLVFVLEQILSNALKYTNAGEISIYMDPDKPYTLVIEDTGIGIEEEDLPRVFEKGFTGYNGRLNKKSTGIGLYLCRRILTKLSHTIKIDSVVGKGTKVKIGLDVLDITIE
ncbi:MAG: HAMP domain-containing histidine kinase [Clostridiales bacterium]|nr:HAMP domain-containing histidine kinase [Clostridiales bacterium]